MTQSSQPAGKPAGQSAGFSGAGRHITEEDQITLTSVGVDIGSSTSHLVFSRLELERQNTRYVIVKRTVLRESEILLTPYVDDGTTIDADALGSNLGKSGKLPASAALFARIAVPNKTATRNHRCVHHSKNRHGTTP